MKKKVFNIFAIHTIIIKVDSYLRKETMFQYHRLVVYILLIVLLDIEHRTAMMDTPLISSLLFRKFIYLEKGGPQHDQRDDNVKVEVHEDAVVQVLFLG